MGGGLYTVWGLDIGCVWGVEMYDIYLQIFW